MIENFFPEMVSQVALLLLIGIAFGLLFGRSAVGRSGAQGVQCVAISKQEWRPRAVTVYVRLANPMCRKERPSCRRGE